MFKKIFWVIIILIFLSGSATIYLNTYFLPEKAKPFLISKLQESTHRPVSIQGLAFTPAKGLIIKNINI